MPARRATPGTKQLNLEIAEKLFNELKAFVAGRGQTMRHAVEGALRRHLDNPPPILPLPRLPDVPPEAVPAKPAAKGRSRKKG